MNSLARRTACGRRGGVRCALTAAAWAMACVAARAGDFSVGVGAGLDRGQTDCVAAYPCDRGSTHAKLFVGYEAAPNIELQVLGFDAGHFDGGTLDAVVLGLAPHLSSIAGLAVYGPKQLLVISGFQVLKVTLP